MKIIIWCIHYKIDYVFKILETYSAIFFTKLSANTDLITLELNKGKQLKTSFSYMGQIVKQLYIFGYLRDTGPTSIIRLGLSCFPAILSPMSM